MCGDSLDELVKRPTLSCSVRQKWKQSKMRKGKGEYVEHTFLFPANIGRPCMYRAVKENINLIFRFMNLTKVVIRVKKIV